MTETERAPQSPSGSPHRWSALEARVRNRLTAGVILVLPIWITLLLGAFVFRLMRDGVATVVTESRASIARA